MNEEELEYAVKRIEHMEKMFDEVQAAFKSDNNFFKNEGFERKISLLTQYMESGQWLRDYSLDEKGELPKDLKRGVLSEDGLYNLLSDIDNAKNKKSGMFKKLFEKDEILFAVAWIVVYVIGFSTADSISESIGIPKLLTAIFGFILSAVAFIFAKKNGLLEHFGLCKTKIPAKNLLFYVPLILISSVNIWNGFSFDILPLTAVLSVLSMCFVGFLEEIIFRGMLFTGMSKNGLKSAIIVSSLTFGIGHIVNLLSGAPVFDTVLQLIYASAVGFCYTAIFYVGKSILPCIISHAAVNSMSIFAAEHSETAMIILAAAQTVVSVGYGIWLLKKNK